MTRHIVPDLVFDQVLTIVPPTCTVIEAAKAMAHRNIGAVIVAEHGMLSGIFSERDLAHRVVARGRDPEITQMRDVMTASPETVGPDDSPSQALTLMRKHGCRHLPVVDGARIVGMLSIRDLYAAIQQDLEDDLRMRDELFMGSGYSITH